MTTETMVLCDLPECQARIPWPLDTVEKQRTAAMSEWVRVTIAGFPFVHHVQRDFCCSGHYVDYLVELGHG